MTIYKFSNVEKKPVKKDELLDVVTVPLNESEETAPTPRSPAYIFVRPRRSRACANVIVVFLALVVLAAGIIGGIYLYKHLVHKATYGVCGVRYFEEDEYLRQPHSEFRYMEEKVEVPNDKVEKIEVPQFDECEKSLVLHDFESNFTAIVDKDKFRCFVMKLNRTLVAPPKDMVDLIWKLRSGYYMPDAMIVRRKYRVMMPALRDLTMYGPYIRAECEELSTFRLEHIVGGRNIWKRSVGEVGEKHGETYRYGYFGGQQPDGSVRIAKIELLDVY